jgi:hypothetical protein
MEAKNMKNKKLSQPKSQGPIQLWAEKVNWANRVKAVCKPCWEIKYCPYGPLVEEFPLSEEHGERSCRIFGHDCPVFYVAEPLTETKELRRITRTIPRPLQFRVLKRDNQICRECGTSVKDEDIHFDHIIPWSRGGPTEEHNIRLLCGDCNRRKSDKFEDKYLVESFVEHVTEPVGFDFVEFLLDVALDSHGFRAEHDMWPDALTLAEWFEVEKVTEAENHMVQVILDLDEFFAGDPPCDVPPEHFSALRFRWGWEDGSMHNVSRVVGEFDMTADELLEAELALMRRLGWRVELSAREKKRWLKS